MTRSTTARELRRIELGSCLKPAKALHPHDTNGFFDAMLRYHTRLPCRAGRCYALVCSAYLVLIRCDAFSLCVLYHQYDRSGVDSQSMTVNHTPFRSDLFTSGGAVCSTQCRLADLLTVRACAAGSGGGAGGGAGVTFWSL